MVGVNLRSTPQSTFVSAVLSTLEFLPFFNIMALATLSAARTPCHAPTMDV